MEGGAGARFHFVPELEWSMSSSPGSAGSAPTSSMSGHDKDLASLTKSRATASQDKENVPLKVPNFASPIEKPMKEIQQNSTPVRLDPHRGTNSPMYLRWAKKSTAELCAKHAQLSALRHHSMLQRAALACGDDDIQDSPEFLRLQEMSCTERMREIQEELQRRGDPLQANCEQPSCGTEAFTQKQTSVSESASFLENESKTSTIPITMPNSGDTTDNRLQDNAESTIADVPEGGTANLPTRQPMHHIQTPTSYVSDDIEIIEMRRGSPKSQSPWHEAIQPQSEPVDAPRSKSATNERYPWDAQVKHSLRRLFKLTDFRPDQLEAINATLRGQDVFCLMPTGGGKSLCFQLPATVTMGKTDGLTVVISPLIALIHNQVKNLLKLEIPTLAITGDMSEEDRRFASAELYKRDSHVRLLYVTPEFVCNSRLASNILMHLNTQKRLARFVIDEAHCVDQWGHDFRPDYVRLEMLRQEYPLVPLMALTATARIDTVKDIQRRLGMRDALVLRQSFNRPNLSYSVLPKRRGNGTLEDMASFIQTKHAGECGIIYCLSRRDCENVASDLIAKFNIQARHFHAGLDTKDKLRIQDNWEAGHFQVIVATIAFGMGIDKGDVRFVIHHSIPKSLEGYYQETGRAGRDGKASECVLYWSMNDARKLEGMINESDDASPQQKRHQLQTLRQVTAFCQALTECRRTNILKYFGEQFDSVNCHASCDNCRRAGVQQLNVTTAAQDFVRMVQTLGGRNVHLTKAYFMMVFKGSMRKDVKEKGHHRNMYHGRGASYTEEQLKRIVDHLLHSRFLEEYAKKAAYQKFPSHYLRLGPEATNLLQGQAPIYIEMPTDGSAVRSAVNPIQARSTVASFDCDDWDLSSIPLSPPESAHHTQASRSRAKRSHAPNCSPTKTTTRDQRAGPTPQNAAISKQPRLNNKPRFTIAPMPLGFTNK